MTTDRPMRHSYLQADYSLALASRHILNMTGCTAIWSNIIAAATKFFMRVKRLFSLCWKEIAFYFIRPHHGLFIQVKGFYIVSFEPFAGLNFRGWRHTAGEHWWIIYWVTHRGKLTRKWHPCRVWAGRRATCRRPPDQHCPGSRRRWEPEAPGTTWVQRHHRLRPTADRWASDVLNAGRTWSSDRDRNAAVSAAAGRLCRTVLYTTHNIHNWTTFSHHRTAEVNQ